MDQELKRFSKELRGEKQRVKVERYESEDSRFLTSFCVTSFRIKNHSNVKSEHGGFF